MDFSNCRVGSLQSKPANQMIVIIAFLCYLLASAFFLLCVMLTARGKEYGSRVTAPSKHSGALSSCATMPPTFMRSPEPVEAVDPVAPVFQTHCVADALLLVRLSDGPVNGHHKPASTSWKSRQLCDVRARSSWFCISFWMLLTSRKAAKPIA